MVALARFIRMPSIVAYLLAGLLVGPVTGWLGRPLATHAGATAIGELGIVLLMFLVGAELSFTRIRQVGGVALVAGLGQVVFTALGGFAICAGLGFDVMESIFLATALTFSSTVVVVKLLDQKGDLDSLYGQIAVGIFLVQDLVVIVVLTFLAGLDSPESLGLASVGLGTLKAFAGMAAMLAGCIVAARRVLPRPFAWAARSPRTLGASAPAHAALARCAQPVQVFRGGQAVEARCPDEARAAGLTVLELGDAWTPYPLHDAAVAAGTSPPPYHTTFIALAAGDFAGDTQAEYDRYLELYGVPPNLRVVLAAMDDDARHRCHDAIDDGALAGLAVPLRRDPPERVVERRRELARLQAQIDGALRGGPQAQGLGHRAANVARPRRHPCLVRPAEHAGQRARRCS